MNGSTLTLGLVGLAALAGASRRGSMNAGRPLRVWVVPREVLAEAFREDDGRLNVVRVAGLAGRGLRMLDVQDILRDRIEDSGDEEGELDRLHRELSEVASFFDGMTFPLTVYRGILLSGRSQAKLLEEQVGEHWTPNRGIALRFARGEHDASERSRRKGDVPMLLTGQISSPGQIDWRQTFSLYLGYSVEHFPGGIDPQQQVYSSAVKLLKAQEV